MSEPTNIPMFPLTILPLPGELVPLHIFEPRYRQLLQDAEVNDIQFGIYFTHEINDQKIGSLVKLESVIKRYPGGEADIIVKCDDIFTMGMLTRTYRSKPYPGGEVRVWSLDQNTFPGHELYDLFLAYLKLRNINQHVNVFNLYQIANELNMDVSDRYRFLTSPEEKKEVFVLNRIKFQMHLLQQEEKSKDNYYLN
ncbi:LON peptidase substrate-binding domain-containing protein [Chryseolinea sp. T2]|uniref:LON peptidase substrate-binding domain-containing protein n=1 Tax=Chryseolinea sp. T2 TaxID=3129255 RepID=UPI0030785EFB